MRTLNLLRMTYAGMGVLATGQAAPTVLNLSVNPGDSSELTWVVQGMAQSVTMQACPDLGQWKGIGGLLLVNSLGRFEDPWDRFAVQKFYRLREHEEPPHDALLRQREIWRAKGLVDYSFDFQWQCSCLPDYVTPVRITVTQGKITKVVRRGVSLAMEEFRKYHTIEGLFSDLLEAIDGTPHSMRVEFDGECGYPGYGFIDQAESTVDEERGFSVRDLRAAGEPAPVQITERPPGEVQLDPFSLMGARVSEHQLTLNVQYGGGCREHDLELFMSPAVFAESFPVQANLYVRHAAHGDPCKGLVHREVTFDLRPIAELYAHQHGGSDPIQLNVFDYFEEQPGDKISVSYSPGGRK